MSDLTLMRGEPGGALAAVRQIPWDSDAEMIYLVRSDVASVLRAYMRGQLSSAELEAWANAIEVRKISVSSRGAKMLHDIIFQAANPTLFEPISIAWTKRWLTQVND